VLALGDNNPSVNSVSRHYTCGRSKKKKGSSLPSRLRTVAATVAIPNWNGLSFLKECIQELRNQSFKDFHVLVIDNGSSDGSVQWLASQKDIQTIFNSVNRGFAAANNQALAEARGQFFVTLNNDTLPHPRFLEELVSTLEAGADLGSAAAVITWKHQPDIVASAGIDFHKDGTATDHLSGKTIETVAEGEIFGASAGAAAYRTDLMRALGGFYEGYFAYLEDADLAWRLRLCGHRCRLARGALVRHVHSATLGRQSPLRRYLLSRNRIWLILRCIPNKLLLKWWPHIVAYEAMSLAEALAKGDWPRLRGRLTAMMQIPQLMSERRAVQSLLRVDLKEIETLIQPPIPWKEALRIHYMPEKATL
jgi:GT2 family glycosyltransferase